jgi:poly(A) polymerase
MKLDAPWLASLEVQTLAVAFEKAGFELRFVGGCVRDTIMKRPVHEMDAATDATPQQTTALLEATGLRAIPTGIEHGTITALVDERTFEITTLRKDVNTDGRHAEVAFTTAWEEDAKRRDFTMNALYVGMDGTLYDYVGGLDDCKALRVKFIGDANARIREDYLRILRYFRFVATVGDNHFDEEALAACAANKEGIATLSGERIAAEIMKLLSSDTSAFALQKMQEADILSLCIPVPKAHTGAVAKLDEIDARALVKLAALIADGAMVEAAQNRLKLSSKQSRALKLWIDHYAQIDTQMSMHAQQKLVRKLGADYTPVLQLAYALSNETWDVFAPLQDMQDWPVPVFPVSAQDLMVHGFSEGKALGGKLKELEIIWEESGYKRTREELLTSLR